MITIEELRSADPRDLTGKLAFTASALVRASRLALENDGSGVSDVVRIGDAGTVLEVAELLLGVLEEGACLLEREAKRGFWKL